MKHISELVKALTTPFKIPVLPKKEVISLIAQKVIYSDDPLKNWKIIARRLKPASPLDATKIYLSIKKGTFEDSRDYKGAFEFMCRKLVYVKKPKQNKLL
jgi:hypothetical protein